VIHFISFIYCQFHLHCLFCLPYVFIYIIFWQSLDLVVIHVLYLFHTFQCISPV